MRLTLRNLLRFLDQTNLRTIERSRLEQLVDESEKAEAWIKRIETLKQNRDTVALAIESQDPPVNRVAAYLDSTMGEQATVEFEKSMLSSDTLLAEVASCHEIREALRSHSNPAIPILLRQSAYDIGRGQVNDDRQDAEAATDNGDGEQSVASLAATMEDLPYVDGKPDDPKPIGGFSDEGDEPDEESVTIESLSQKAQKRSRLVMTCLLLLVAGLLGLTYWLGVQAGRRPNMIAGNPDATSTDSGKDKTTVSEEGTAGKSGDNTTVGDTGTSGSENKGSAEDGAEGNEDEVADDSIAAIHPQPATANAEDDSESEDESVLPDRPLIAPVRLADAEPPVRVPVVVASVADQKPTLLTRTGNQDATIPPVPPGECSFGTDRPWDPGVWSRVQQTGSLLEGNELIVLPGTASQLDLGGNLTIRIEGPARFCIGQRDVSSGADVLVAAFGRYTVTSKVGDIDLLLEHGGRRYRLTIPVPESRVTVEFSSYQAPGADPRSIQPASTDYFIANKGRLTLSEAGKTWMLPESNAMFRSVSGNPGQAREAMTGLIDLPIERPRDYSIRLTDTIGKNFQDLSEQLKTDAPVSEFLVDLKSDIRQERRFAALSWLAYTGNYAYLIDFLNDDKNRNNWRSVVEAVRASIHYTPQHAAALYESLSLAGQEERDIMFKLLLGYTQDELAGGEDEALVKLLDHDALCVRVLAIERIRQITGGLAYGYNPNADRKVRRRIIDKQWQKALKKKELQYSEPPALPVPVFANVPLNEDDNSDTGKNSATGSN